VTYNNSKAMPIHRAGKGGFPARCKRLKTDKKSAPIIGVGAIVPVQRNYDIGKGASGRNFGARSGY
jgi:hypothetical protein